MIKIGDTSYAGKYEGDLRTRNLQTGEIIIVDGRTLKPMEDKKPIVKKSKNRKR